MLNVGNVSFRVFRVKSKLEMKHFKGKMTGIFYVLVWRGYQQIVSCGFHFRGYKELVECGFHFRGYKELVGVINQENR